MNKDLILLDTNNVIYALQGDPIVADFADGKKGVISFVTEIELLGWKSLTPRNKEAIKIFLNDCMFVEYNARIKQATR